MTNDLTHFDKDAHPRMVDISQKAITTREAIARTEVVFPETIWKILSQNAFATKKGSLLDVARIAGTMAVKHTADWIPFCHTLPIDGCDFTITAEEKICRLIITCRVNTTARTGVEMEALTGASAAALTIYDMSKSLGHGLEITSTRLLSKTGGKQDYTC
ncbi:MAG: cyclic pyranopterin monophosphate synthase MoaC [Chthoniobacterales bacterium]